MSLLTDPFPNLCKILRMSSNQTPDNIGVSVHSFTLVADEVECWAQTLSETEVSLFEQLAFTADRKIYFKTNQRLTPRHVVVITHCLLYTSPSPRD